MNKKSYINLIVIFAIILLIGTASFTFYKSDYFMTFFEWSQNNTFLLFIIIIILKAIAVIYPPLPGSVIALSAISILGWYYAYLADFLGSLIGSSVSYYLGKHYGYTIVNKFISKTAVTKIKSVKIKHKREIEAVIVMRLLAGTIAEAINYCAGLLNIKYRNFLIGFIVSHPLVGIPIFYTAGSILAGKNLIINIFLILLAIPVLYRLKGRYFE